MTTAVAQNQSPQIITERTSPPLTVISFKAFSDVIDEITSEMNRRSLAKGYRFPAAFCWDNADEGYEAEWSDREYDCSLTVDICTGEGLWYAYHLPTRSEAEEKNLGPIDSASCSQWAKQLKRLLADRFAAV